MFLTFVNRTLTLLLLAGSTLLLLFVVFSGAVNSFPFNRFYWIQIDTSSFDDKISRYTFWGICNPSNYDSSSNGNCDSTAPDYPFSPYDNFGNFTNIPNDFIENRDTYYYLSRFGFPLILISLVFSGVSFICALFQTFWKSMKQVLSFFVTLALIFGLAGVSCQTAVTVLLKNKFKDSGFNGKLGASMYGMSWAAMACLILSFFLCCCSTMHRAYKLHQQNIKSLEQGDYYQQQPTQGQQPIQPVQTTQQQQQQQPIQQQNQQQIAPISTTDNQSIDNDQTTEGGIRFFKVQRNKGTDEESI